MHCWAMPFTRRSTEWALLWTGCNLASAADMAEVKRELSQWLPKIDRPLAPNSHARVLSWDGTTAVWEGEVINPDELER